MLKHTNATTTAALRPLGAFGLLSKLSTRCLSAVGWRVDMMANIPEKCVIVVYPHTSNWDFIVGLAAKWATGLSARREIVTFAAKESLFRWPWGAFFKGIGGFPVRRDQRSGFVEQMVAQFASSQRIRFVLAPEGTRKYLDHLRSSFYYVACGANVPIVFAVLDFAQKQVIMTETFVASGELSADLVHIERYYQQFDRPGHTPENAAPWRFKNVEAKQQH